LEQEPQLLGPPRMLSSCQPFPWSRKVHEADHCVLNMVPCDNEFELAFSKFLDDAEDVQAFSKLPQPFGFPSTIPTPDEPSFLLSRFRSGGHEPDALVD
jgi:hypothetical protein